FEKYTVEAVDLVADADDPGLRGEALAVLAWLKFFAGDDDGLAVAGEAVRLLRQSPVARSRFALVDALWGLGFYRIARGDGPAGLAGDLDGGLAAVRTAVEEAGRRQQFVILAFGALLFLSLLEARAEPARVPASLEQTEQTMGEGGLPWGAAWCGAIRSEAL